MTFIYFIALVCLIRAGNGLPVDVELDLEARMLERVSFRVCLIDPGERQACGGRGVNEQDCYARECCWGGNEHNGAPSCYHSSETNSKLCAASEDKHEPCGWDGIRKEQCISMKCCWRPTMKSKSQWCIKKQRNPVYTGECGMTAIRPNTIPGRITGGQDAIPNSWPWMASLQRQGDHFCGGSLINEQWVLMAAHCKPPDGEEVLVVLGAHNKSMDATEKTKVTVPASQLFAHEQFPGNGLGFDFMLVKLARPVEFNSAVSPLCLAKEAPKDGKRCYSMGWGLTELSYDDYVFEATVPDILQQFMSPVVDTERCNSTEMYNGRIHFTSMCAGYEEGGRGNCYGDSGGPLVCKDGSKWSQVGIVSWGEPCALAMYPTVYAEVSLAVEWMEDIIGEN